VAQQKKKKHSASPLVRFGLVTEEQLVRRDAYAKQSNKIDRLVEKAFSPRKTKIKDDKDE